MFARTVAAWLTVSKSFGCDFSKFSTEAVNPSRAASSNFGCFSVRLASWVDASRKWAILRASSSWLRARASTSSRRVATNCRSFSRSGSGRPGASRIRVLDLAHAVFHHPCISQRRLWTVNEGMTWTTSGVAPRMTRSSIVLRLSVWTTRRSSLQGTVVWDKIVAQSAFSANFRVPLWRRLPGSIATTASARR